VIEMNTEEGHVVRDEIASSEARFQFGALS